MAENKNENEKKQRKKKIETNDKLQASITADISKPIEAYNNIPEDPIPALIENKDYIEAGMFDDLPKRLETLLEDILKVYLKK